MPTVALFKGCALRPSGVSIDQPGCTDIARVPARNKAKCCAVQCASPWRLCVACVEQGSHPAGIVNVKDAARKADGLCDFHASNGRGAIKTRTGSVGKVIASSEAVARLQERRAGMAIAMAASVTAPLAAPNKPGLSRDPVPAVVQMPKPAALRASTILTAVASAEDDTEARWREILGRVKRALAASTYEAAIDPRRIRAMKGQPRTVFNEVRLLRLRASIIESGQIQPITLRRIEPDEDGCDFELVDGERRWRSSTAGAEVLALRAMIVDIDDEAARYVIAVLANFNREEHTPLEICDAVTRMHEELKMPMETIAKMFGKSVQWINQRYGLRRLVADVRELLDPELEEHECLSVTAAIRISQMQPTAQLEAARRVIRGELHVNQIREDALSRGNAVNLYQRTPSHQIELLGSNVASVLRLVEKFKQAVFATSGEVLRSAKPATRQSVLVTVDLVIAVMQEIKARLASYGWVTINKKTGTDGD